MTGPRAATVNMIRTIVLLSKLDIIYIKNSKIDSFNNNRSYVKWSILKKSIIFKVPEGVQHFSGGGGGGGGSNFFQRGGGPIAYSL